MSEVFAATLFDFQREQEAFKDRLSDAGFDDYERLWGDDYDSSIEFGDVGNDARLSPEQQKVIYEAGFARAFVNHKDGWETYYHWKPGAFVAARGWRRRWVDDPTVNTTRSIGAPADKSNSGYYEISYWPEGWGANDALQTGYMRIVPDPMEPDARTPSDCAVKEGGE